MRQSPRRRHYVLLRRIGPTVPELADIGVRWISTGGALAFATYRALARAAPELLDSGTTTYLGGFSPRTIGVEPLSAT